MTRAHSTGGRALAAAVAGCVLAGSLLLVAGGRPWAQRAERRPLQTSTETVFETTTATTPAPGAVGAVGLVALAGGAGLLATRRTARPVAGLVLCLSAVLVLGVTANAASSAVGRTGWPLVAAGAAALLLVTGGATLVRGRGWPVLGRRYDAPGGEVVPLDPTSGRAADTWDALDRGEDPTAPAEPRPDR